MNNLMSIRQLFDFIVDDSFGCDDEVLDSRLEVIQEQNAAELEARERMFHKTDAMCRHSGQEES